LIQGKELLHVKNLSVSHIEKKGSTKIVDRVDLKIHEGETVGLIGPTGTGKTVAAKAILRLLGPLFSEKSEWEIDGKVLYRDRDLMCLSEDELRELRGKELSIIFQNPPSSLNPILMIGQQTGEPMEAHEEIEAQRLRELVIEYLGKVELPDARRRSRFFRHQFSGGEAQRIMIAMALSCNPSLLMCDEPTTSVDVTVQAQLLELLQDLRNRLGMAVLIITHNLGVIARYVDRVNVMYAGRLVEMAATDELYANPLHPYTMGLLASVPRLDSERKVGLRTIKGLPPHLARLPRGCYFHPRCDYAFDRCREERPELEEETENHFRACFLDIEKLQK